MAANVVGIIHRGEDPELRRHRQEVLGKSRVWRAVVVVCAIAIAAAFAAEVIDLLFG